jgi:hypothetical protein
MYVKVVGVACGGGWIVIVGWVGEHAAAARQRFDAVGVRAQRASATAPMAARPRSALADDESAPLVVGEGEALEQY